MHPDFETSFSFDDQNFLDLGLSGFQGSILQLVHVRGDAVTPLGTCFAITNSGICMTARHVVEEGLRHIAVEPGFNQMDEDVHGSFSALLITTQVNTEIPDGLVGGLIPIWRIWMASPLDIALVSLKLPVHVETEETIPFPSFPLRMTPPDITEPFFSIGYRLMEWTEGDDSHDHSVVCRFSATKGEVQEVHLGGRDSAMLPFPCFRTSARFDGGMSGGPLMDHFGRVFGVVCSSYGTEDGADHISYASLLAPSMGITVNTSDTQGNTADVFLWDFVEGGAIDVDKANVVAHRDGDNLILTVAPHLQINATLNS